MENSHNAVQGGVGGRFWAVRCGATRLSWVWPEICWLWLEQSIPYHGAWCSGKFLKTFGTFILPVQVSLTCHISLFQGVRSYCVTKCLHDPHAPRAQLWHLKVSLQSELPLLLDDSEGRVPPRPFSKVRFCCSQVPHSTEEHLKTVSMYFSTQENARLVIWGSTANMLLCYMCVQRNEAEAHVSAEDYEIKALILLFDKSYSREPWKPMTSATHPSDWWRKLDQTCLNCLKA